MRKKERPEAGMPRPKGSPRAPEPAPRVPLKQRRAKQRRALMIFFSVLGALALALAAYLVWLPALRIAEVRASGPDAEDAARIARGAIAGTHAFVLPRNSIFFLPQGEIKEAVLAAHPEVQAVSLKAEGMNGLLVTTVLRTPSFLWCGESPDALDLACWQADADGMIFASADPGAPADLKVFAAVTASSQDPFPIRAKVGRSDALPITLQAVKALRGLGADVASLAFRDDEVDLRTRAGTRITYVLGREDAALTLAQSGLKDLNLNDGSVEYVDLRFENKLFVKRRGAAETAGS
jgi:hypothetical protein